MHAVTAGGPTRRRKAASARAAHAPLRPAAQVKLPATIELGTFSRAAGPWRPDFARARADALALLKTIDFSKREIVLWVPGTDATGVHPDFNRAMKYLYQDGGLSLNALKYEATWDLRSSMPTGLATLKFVLEGIRQRLEAMPPGARPKVRLAGLSQGAWIIGEALADPKVGRVVDRAALVGHPWLAAHRYENGEDPRVKVINHRGDQIAMEIKGNIGIGMDAMTAVRTGNLWKQFGTVAKAILANPIHGVLLLQNHLTGMDSLRPFTRDPHEYSMEMTRLVNYLKTGVMDKTNEELDEEKRKREA